MLSLPSFRSPWSFFHITLFFSCVHGFLQRDIVRDGLSSALTGYGGTAFQATRYEPLCGTLGEASDRTSSFSIQRCGPVVMNAYSNISDPFAVYDESGVRLTSVVVGGGRDVCMCFSLSTASGRAADMCWWVGGDGQVDIAWQLQLDYVITGSFRPGSAKSLPQCSQIDLSAAQASWSATAATRGALTGTPTLPSSGKSIAPAICVLI